jgi:hypothetical protein
MALQITLNDLGGIKVMILKGQLRLGAGSVEFRGKIKDALSNAIGFNRGGDGRRS